MILTCLVTLAHGPEQPVSNTGPNVKIAVAKFILTLKEKFKLTQTSLNYTVKAVEELLLLSNKSLEQSMADNLDNPLSLGSPFDDLRTEYQPTKCFRENFGLIVSNSCVCVQQNMMLLLLFHGQEPVTCELGTSFRYQKSGTTRQLVEVKDLPVYSTFGTFGKIIK